MAKYSGSGWHKQSTRHSNARKYGKAGGHYATPIYAGNKIIGYFNIVAIKKTDKNNMTSEQAKEILQKVGKHQNKYFVTDKEVNEARKTMITDFENMKENVELRALSNTSLQRPLNDKEYQRFMELSRKAGILIEKPNQKAYKDVPKWLKETIEKAPKKHYGKTNTYQPTNFIPKNTMELPVQFSITIPSTKNIDESIGTKGLNQRVKEINKWIIDKFNGDTTIRGKGDYDNKGKLINEDIGIIDVSTTPQSYEEHKKELAKLIKDLREEYGQKQMAYSIEGNLFLYPQNPKKTLFKNNPELNKKMLTE